MSARKSLLGGIFALCLVLLAGCATTPNNLAETDIAFTKTVQQLQPLTQKGIITHKQAKAVTPYVNDGNSALDEAWQAYATGQPKSAAGYLLSVNNALAQIVKTLHQNAQAKP